MIVIVLRLDAIIADSAATLKGQGPSLFVTAFRARYLIIVHTILRKDAGHNYIITAQKVVQVQNYYLRLYG